MIPPTFKSAVMVIVEAVTLLKIASSDKVPTPPVEEITLFLSVMVILFPAVNLSYFVFNWARVTLPAGQTGPCISCSP